jgi:hypothetical protein
VFSSGHQEGEAVPIVEDAVFSRPRVFETMSPGPVVSLHTVPLQLQVALKLHDDAVKKTFRQRIGNIAFEKPISCDLDL